LVDLGLDRSDINSVAPLCSGWL